MHNQCFDNFTLQDIISVGDLMKKTIIEILERHVDAFGIVSVDEYIQTRSSLQKDDIFSDYSKFEGYQTILTLGLSYPSLATKWAGKQTGVLSRYCYGTDYHIVFRGIIQNIEKALSDLGIKTLGSVDISFVDERWAGYVSNLGFLGKNQYLIHPEFGGYLYLATILIDVPIGKDFQVLDTCGTCRICIDACPTNALDGGFIKERCISELTQSKKTFSFAEMTQLQTMVYGCDICQIVCPKNKGIDVHLHPEFEPDGKEIIDLISLLQMSNRDYLKQYKNNASSWKGATVIKRNAICLLMNQGIIESIPIIQKSIESLQNVSWYNSVGIKAIKELERKK